MPSRLLREGIIDSTAVNALSFPAEVFYRRLMSVVDDFGRFDGRPSMLRSRLYPLKVESVREADILRWMAECLKAELIALYACDRAGRPRWIAICEKAGLTVSGDEKPYILFHRLGTPRAKESKYPPPPKEPADGTRDHTPDDARALTQTDVNGCAQVKTDAPYSYSGSYSGAGPASGASGPEPAVPPAPEDPPDTIPFDPLVAAQAARKDFERRWAQAGLRKFSRLTPFLQTRLEHLLRGAWWAEHYPVALQRAGANPWLRDGSGRQNGALDVSEFLRDEECVRKIIDGVFDQRSAAPKGGDVGNAKARFEAALAREQTQKKPA